MGKAKNFKERFKDVISDPLNLLINRVPEAGYVDASMNVFLHNGLKVPINGKYAYYDDFSDILILNRGVHEPLEEFCFQEVLKIIDKKNPIMLELVRIGHIIQCGFYKLLNLEKFHGRA